jgi:hypothetical protein
MFGTDTSQLIVMFGTGTSQLFVMFGTGTSITNITEKSCDVYSPNITKCYDVRVPT